MIEMAFIFMKRSLSKLGEEHIIRPFHAKFCIIMMLEKGVLDISEKVLSIWHLLEVGYVMPYVSLKGIKGIEKFIVSDHQDIFLSDSSGRNVSDPWEEMYLTIWML